MDSLLNIWCLSWILEDAEGESKMENPKKLATLGTQDEEKTKQKHNTCVRHHHTKQTQIT